MNSTTFRSHVCCFFFCEAAGEKEGRGNLAERRRKEKTREIEEKKKKIEEETRERKRPFP